MKFSTALTSLILIIPLFTTEAFGAAAFGGKGQGGRGAGKGAGAGAGKGAGAAGAGAGQGAAQNATAAAAANSTAAANTTAANTTAANTTAANNAGAGAVNNGNPQTSTTLDPAVIAQGFAQNGQGNGAVAGQVASLTSTNNFINFCLTVPGKPLTNGQQIKTGSCNPAPMGVIAATTNMPSSKFVTPVNGQDIAANTAFDITMAVSHLQTGNFVNAASNYYSAPQQVNGAGDIVGHTHFTVSSVQSFTSTAPQDPNTFAFFKGVNAAAVNGQVTESVTAGLPAGVYRLCSINTDANHTPCLVAVAQHGTLDDCVYFSVGGSGNNPFAAGNAAAGNATAAAGSAAGAAVNATAGAGAAVNATAGAGAAVNATAAAGAGKGAAAKGAAGKGAAGAGAGKGAAGAGKGANKPRFGGRSMRLSGSRLGRDY
jgi:hypothetical protein